MIRAGIRDCGDIVEQEGVRRTYRALEDAECILVVLDGSSVLEEQDRAILHRVRDKRHLVVLNKADLGLRVSADTLKPQHTHAPIVAISATTGLGLDALKDSLKTVVLQTATQSDDRVIVTQVRHKNALCTARDALELVLTSIHDRQPGECLALDLRAAVDALGDIVGVTTTDDILGRIFSEFCIGK